MVKIRLRRVGAKKAPLSLTGMSRDTSGAVILFRYCR